MSPASARALRLGTLLFVAICAQCVFANTLRVRSVTPDIPLVVAILGSMFHDANGGATIGFATGIFHAALAAPPSGGFTALIVSRLLVCFGVGWLEERVFRESVPLAIGLVALGSLLAECLFFVIAPQPNIAHWFRQMLATTLYNMVFALPIYLIVHRWIGSLRDTEDNFF